MSLDSVRQEGLRDFRDEQRKLWRDSVPRGLQGYNLDNLLNYGQYASMPKVNKRKIIKFTKFDKDTPTFLLLHGGVGLGKTALALSIVEKMFDNNVISNARFMVSTTAMLRMSYGENDATPEKVIQEMSKPQLLIIDDLGVNSDFLTPARKSGFWSVIDRRWSDHKPTIITSNLMESSNNPNYPGLKQYLGESTWDRISGDMNSVRFMGESIRNSVTPDVRKG